MIIYEVCVNLYYYELVQCLQKKILNLSSHSKTLDAEKEKTKVWKFHRIALVREFQRRSIMPPFVIVDAIIALFKKCLCQKSANSHNPWSMYTLRQFVNCYV